MKNLCSLALAAVLSALATTADSQIDPLIGKVEKLKSEQAVVFISDCEFRNAKYLLMFRAGELQGGYAQLTHTDRGPVTTNFGGVVIEGGKWRVIGSTGGIASGSAQSAVMDYLMKAPFFVLPADQLDSIYSRRSTRACNF
jgi:hypothetical protein